MNLEIMRLRGIELLNPRKNIEHNSRLYKFHSLLKFFMASKISNSSHGQLFSPKFSIKTKRANKIFSWNPIFFYYHWFYHILRVLVFAFLSKLKQSHLTSKSLWKWKTSCMFVWGYLGLPLCLPVLIVAWALFFVAICAGWHRHLKQHLLQLNKHGSLWEVSGHL